MNKVYHYLFITIHWILFLSLRIQLVFRYKRGKSKKSVKNSVAILPHYPEEWPGGDRLCYWANDFKENGYQVSIFDAWSCSEMENYLKLKSNSDSFELYRFYLVLLYRRVSVFKTILENDVIWVQRNLIPIFPFKHAYYEKLLSKYHSNIIYDYYDADYTSNYNLVIETVKNASKVTVASKYLENFHLKFNKKVFFLRYCIDDQKYIKRKNRNDNKIRIGWMGSPDNAIHLKTIESDLKLIEKENNNVEFSFVCRSKPNLDLSNSEHCTFDNKNFNYYDWISSIDIGIVPFFGESDRVKAKISKKCIEFMACGQIILTSPWVHSDVIENGINAFITNKDEWGLILQKVIDEFPESLNYGDKVFEAYNNNHKKKKLITPLINFLTN
ncbi:MAG: glycosyltransferase family 4 protein [Flavobacteriales bacterium]|nr:glycosyltransferase family 4 protein [Flavobacteriales bacterium]